MITAIVIPAHSAHPVRVEQIAPVDLDVRQRLVGGTIQALNLYKPPSTMYINDEGKLLDLRPNPRATSVLWVHNPDFRNHDFVVGDAIIVGQPDEQGNDETAPQELVDIIFNTNRFYAEVQTHGSEEWFGDNRVYKNWYAAYRWAAIQSVAETVEEVRVIEAR